MVVEYEKNEPPKHLAETLLFNDSPQPRASETASTTRTPSHPIPKMTLAICLPAGGRTSLVASCIAGFANNRLGPVASGPLRTPNVNITPASPLIILAFPNVASHGTFS